MVDSERRQNDRWKKKHQAIVTAAAELFLSRGFDRVNMDDLAVEAGVSKATVYRHFENKEQLYVDMIESFCMSAGDRNPEIDITDARGALRVIGYQFFKRFYDPKIRALMRSVTHGAMDFPAVGDVFWSSGPGFGFNVIKRILSEIKRRQPSVSIDIESGAWLFLGAISGQPMMHMVCNKSELIDEQMIAERLSSIIDVFLKGIGYKDT